MVPSLHSCFLSSFSLSSSSSSSSLSLSSSPSSPADPKVYCLELHQQINGQVGCYSGGSWADDSLVELLSSTSIVILMEFTQPRFDTHLVDTLLFHGMVVVSTHSHGLLLTSQLLSLSPSLSLSVSLSLSLSLSLSPKTLLSIVTIEMLFRSLLLQQKSLPSSMLFWKIEAILQYDLKRVRDGSRRR
jgi:hypothetical protein